MKGEAGGRGGRDTLKTPRTFVLCTRMFRFSGIDPDGLDTVLAIALPKFVKDYLPNLGIRLVHQVLIATVVRGWLRVGLVDLIYQITVGCELIPISRACRLKGPKGDHCFDAHCPQLVDHALRIGPARRVEVPVALCKSRFYNMAIVSDTTVMMTDGV